MAETETQTAKEYLMVIIVRFNLGDKDVVGKLMAELTTTRFNGTKAMQQHVLDKENLAARLGKLDVKVNDTFLVQFIASTVWSLSDSI